ncbi:hypothetical protein FWD07_03210 [Candidatus Saccharibacteria bacterium]|nr:hypothetical protein [Candidatus Saccharibacteria bacterium]
MNRRVVLIYNPKSSRACEVEREVLLPLRLLFPHGNLIEHKISSQIFEENITEISKVLHENDIVISAGGDGTAAIASNAILATSHKNISIGYLGFGNFDDFAGVFTGRHKTIHDLIAHISHTVDTHPLEVLIDDKHLRFSVLYTTLGITAASCDQFEDKSRRKTLARSKYKKLIYSLSVMIRFYFRVRRTYRITPYTLNEKSITRSTDFFAMNTPRSARILRYRGELYRDPRNFLTTPRDFSRITNLASFMIKSFFGRMPGHVTDSATLVFDNPTELDIQSEGEHRHLKNVQKITIKKSTKHLNVIKLK